jgi:preprotein translocase subunit SecD
VLVNFNREGTELFAELTREYVGEQLAIFLDGELLSQPVIQEEIRGGAATISGNFDAASARELVRNLNFGALPVPIALINTQSIGPSLGEETLQRGVTAGLIGLAAVALFLIFWYRVPGIVAVVSLGIYVIIMLTLFKIIPVTLTAAGVAGFILSIGMAVDANILIFERLKEELKLGKKLPHAIRDGFSRAWLPIRDGNLSSIFTALILFWFGTSIVEGFALTFGVGVLVSMLTAIVITRTFLLSVAGATDEKTVTTLFGSGLK